MKRARVSPSSRARSRTSPARPPRRPSGSAAWSTPSAATSTSAGTALDKVQEIIAGVVEAQATIATAVEEQSTSTAQAQEAIVGASREATRMAADLQRIVDGV